MKSDVNKKSIKSDLARIDGMRDADIDYSDIPLLDKTFLKKATTAWPPAKRQLTIVWMRTCSIGSKVMARATRRALTGFCAL